ncbi:GAF domain-containing protein [Methylobacterium sp. P31]
MRGSEADRLATSEDLRILDTGPDEHLDAVCRLAADSFRVPVVAVTFMNEREVSLIACHGGDATCLKRDEAFCDHVAHGHSGRAFVALDLARDIRFASNPLVIGEPHLRFYAAVPIARRPGEDPGTFCIMDTVPRSDFSEAEIRRLEAFARVVTAHLRWHDTARSREAELQEHGRMSAMLHERDAP